MSWTGDAILRCAEQPYTVMAGPGHSELVRELTWRPMSEHLLHPQPLPPKGCGPHLQIGRYPLRSRCLCWRPACLQVAGALGFCTPLSVLQLHLHTLLQTCTCVPLPVVGFGASGAAMFHTQPLQAMRGLLSRDTTCWEGGWAHCSCTGSAWKVKMLSSRLDKAPAVCRQAGLRGGQQKQQQSPAQRRRRTGVTMCSSCIAPTLQCDQSSARVSYCGSYIDQLPCQHHTAM